MSLESMLSLLSLESPSPEGSIELKTLVFKPKTPKSQVPVPVIVVAQSTTATAAPVIAKYAGVKEPRLANDELTTTFFGTPAKEFSLASLSNDHKDGKIKILIDSSIKDDSETTYILANSVAKLALTGSQLSGFLSVYSPVVVDFIAEASATPAAAPTKSAAPAAAASTNTAKLEDAKLIGVTVDKEADFSNWYSQILTKGEMLDYYDVSGCYILRPASYSIWEKITEWFDKRIKQDGVTNAYFPMFVSSKVLEKEKDHIEGFAPEVAWVTRAGSSELEEPIAIRPTSETVMYPYYAKWIRSHRDLPLKLNQWNSVVRWEFKHPQPFLRTREFLWQEGHTAHLTEAEADEQVKTILDLYAGVYEELLAVPVVKGKKTENEKFAGGLYTTTCESYIPTTGRGIQGATSHHLGQNFSKMFNISVENPLGSDHPKIFANQTSWGLSTRVIGVMVMVHSDNKGLVLPPRVAQHQVVIIPVGITNKTTKEVEDNLYSTCTALQAKLKAADVRVITDFRSNYSPGWRFSDAELKGIPVRLEVGPKDLATDSVLAVRRDNGAKTSISISEIETKIPELLEDIQSSLFKAAKEKFDTHRVIVDEWKDFVPTLNKKNLILAPYCDVPECEDDIKDSSSKQDNGEDMDVDEKAPSMGAKSLCIPYDQPPMKAGQKCIKCDRPAVHYTMFGRSY
ncbi:hypothetical protein CANARDRAFT_29226 [[Candida] arabinofermentans NRRL YB-2248]|uniref:proline--tRNA ligase n=1 Tax=[Candida] arabinofermentans NRRL YB-2248 TaxID=983967 RepID=A0A1E4SY27_9ASCO|nr:hypothetical protein CANARDRAFT_29226 [[Candida] arabinofermentans NRRL YB-2248]